MIKPPATKRVGQNCHSALQAHHHSEMAMNPKERHPRLSLAQPPQWNLKTKLSSKSCDLLIKIPARDQVKDRKRMSKGSGIHNPSITIPPEVNSTDVSVFRDGLGLESKIATPGP